MYDVALDHIISEWSFLKVNYCLSNLFFLFSISPKGICLPTTFSPWPFQSSFANGLSFQIYFFCSVSHLRGFVYLPLSAHGLFSQVLQTDYLFKADPKLHIKNDVFFKFLCYIFLWVPLSCNHFFFVLLFIFGIWV